MVLFLLLISGFCWTITYIQLIRLGFKKKTYGMPFVALALNFSWEALYSYLGLKSNIISIETWIIFFWFILDIFIVLTYFIYGRKYFPKHCNKTFFLPWTFIVFVMSFALQWFFSIEFGDLGKAYSGFIQNLIMSILFINMLVHRGNLKGQSLTIAISKWIGTLAPTILFGIIYGNKLTLVIGLFCSVFDLIYIYFLNDIRKVHVSLSRPQSISKS